ncbi:hypothetical protein AB0M95_27020 [Sphaerisporangium sp. NPDC051017]|uniref:hypothetical protein n=1 Tax=Sphaerisporangium sp. NPDC051017 TaxID=3154636 RepID=UPI0034335395
MTLAQETPTTEKLEDPRELVAPELFAKLVARVQEDMPVATFYAELVVEQALAFLATIAAQDTDDEDAAKLSPSKAVDPGWHAFLAFTDEYHQFCSKLTGGKFIHHLPVLPGTTLGWKSVPHTVQAIRAAGYPVNEAMWQADASCGSTDNCDYRVAELN